MFCTFLRAFNWIPILFIVVVVLVIVAIGIVVVVVVAKFRSLVSGSTNAERCSELH